MTKPFSYKILHELRLVVEYFDGLFLPGDFMELKKTQNNDPEFDPSYNIIADLRTSQIAATRNEILECIGIVQKSMGATGLRQGAMLTSTPNHVVYSMLFAEYSKGQLVRYEVFSTLSEACKWLGLPAESIVYIEETLRSLPE